MFGGVNTQHEHEVLIAQCAQPPALNRNYACPFEELIDVKADGVKPRQNLPLEFGGFVVYSVGFDVNEFFERAA